MTTQQTLDTRSPSPTADTYERTQRGVRHRVTLGGHEINAEMVTERPGDAKSAYLAEYLRGGRPSAAGSDGRPLRLVDLFCGSGGLALGVRNAADELGRHVVTELACDQDTEALEVYSTNHSTRATSGASVADLVDFQIRDVAAEARFLWEPELMDTNEALADIDLIVAGPPCQGHSNLNNSSRRDDRRNALYLTVPAMAVATRARAVVIENVPSVVHDSGRVVDTATKLFESNGYRVSTGVVAAESLGWPQARRRHFMVARRDAVDIALDEVVRALADDQRRSALWAIDDLVHTETDPVMDQRTELSDENVRRIDWLFDNGEYELTLEERPDSHKDGTTYTAVYGRMYPDRPAQTITTGFTSPGRGRYIHPLERRVISPREAARLQGFPDTYRFVVDSTRQPSRAKLAKWIGDAVPMPLGHAAALAALVGADLD